MRLRKELSASFHPQLLNSVQEICKANHLSAFVPNEIAHEVEVFLRRVKTLVLGLQ